MLDLVSAVLSTAYYVSHRNVIWGRLLTVSFNGQTPLLLVTQNIDLQTHKRLNFWATFESLESFGNHLKSLLPAEFARKYRREDYYRNFWCTVNIAGLILMIMQPSCFSLLWIWWQLVMNIVLSWPATHRNRCFLVSALTNPLSHLIKQMQLSTHINNVILCACEFSNQNAWFIQLISTCMLYILSTKHRKFRENQQDEKAINTLKSPNHYDWW